MSEVLRLEGFGASSLLNFQRLLPPGHELVGFEDPSGHFYSAEELKAIEWQEKNKMDIKAHEELSKDLRALLAEVSPKFIRQVRKCFHFGNSFLAVANDDTVWYLRRMDKNTGSDYWERLQDASTPSLPQGDEVAS